MHSMSFPTRRVVQRLCAAAVAATALLCGAAQPASYTFQPVIFPGDNFTQLLGINHDQVIAGYHGNGLTAQTPNKGFTLVAPSSFTSQNFPASAQTQVVAIDPVGNTAGFYVDAGGTTHGFLQSGGHFTTVDAAGTAFNQLLGLNAHGQAAGYSTTDPANVVGERAFVRDTNGTITYLTFPMGTGNSQATGINNAGVVSGFFVDAAGVNHGFVFHGTQMTTLDAPGATFTQALGINDAGQVVGAFMDAQGTHGFVYTNGVFHQVDDPLAVNNAMATTTVNGINDRGQLVGFYVDAVGNTDGFVATPADQVLVSLPATTANAGQALTISATVVGSSPTGALQFQDQGVNLGAAQILSGGNATLTTALAGPGQHSITALYAGDANNAPVNSAATTLTVNATIAGNATSSGGSGGCTVQVGGSADVTLALLALLALSGAVRSRGRAMAGRRRPS